MASSLKFDFFQVELPESEHREFQELLTTVIEMDDDESRTHDVRGYPVRLQHVTNVPRVGHFGEIIRIRLSNLPVKAKTTGETSPLDFDADEGLGEETAFLYNPQLRILVLQRNRSGVGASAFAKYFTDLCHLDGPMFLHPTLRATAMQQFLGMSRIRKIDVRVAGTDSVKGLADGDNSITRVLELGNALRAPSIGFEVSMGRRPGSLVIDAAKRLVKSILKISESTTAEAVKVQITGGSGDDGKDVLDLLEYRIVETVQVDAAGRQLSSEERMAAVREAWANASNELHSIYCHSGD